MSDPTQAEHARIARAAATLSPMEREILAMSAADGLGLPEIARHFGISERRAERLLARALRRFDRALDRAGRPWWRLW